jgi:hypothetical protein
MQGSFDMKGPRETIYEEIEEEHTPTDEFKVMKQSEGP